ncbi:MAG TPA: SIMPL domain-containing protein [Gemmatimonadaceae bacterium]|nr:SIMPL domain-containing protein [Gemmatimonadaceae bacterium]
MRHMTFMMKLVYVAALAAMMPAALAAQTTTTPSREPDIETVGTGIRRVAPDRAFVHVIVQSRASTAAAAASANAAAVQAVTDTLRRAGIDTAITTSSYHVGPDYQPRPMGGEPQVVGYMAHSVLRVRPPRIDMVGRAIDIAFAKGATGVENVWFESSKSEETRREALADAAAAARRDAEQLARALGGSLGELLSVSTAGASDPRRMNMDMAMATAMRGTQVTPREIVVTAAVVTRWRFVPR